MFFLYIPYMCFGGGFEELGWRGFLQPYMEEKMGFFNAVLVTGVIWACWHIPLWFISGTAQAQENFFLFLLFCICLSMVLGMVHTLTQNVIACVLVHAWSNVLFTMFGYHLDTIQIRSITAFVLEAFLSLLICSLYFYRPDKNTRAKA